MTRPFGMLAADTARARAYLDRLGARGLRPDGVVLIGEPGAVPEAARREPTPLFDNITPIVDVVAGQGLSHLVVKTADINDDRVVRAVAALDADLVVFAGPAGAIAKPPLLSAGPSLLHVHPGRLPEYRGSTPMYYSLLAEGTLEATAILLAEDIDHGPIVGRRSFPVPDAPESIDLAYDPWMRAELLTEVVERYVKTGELTRSYQDPSAGETYYVIHPVLKHLAIFRARNTSGPTS